MTHYLKRELVCERLRMALSTSYKVIGTAYGSRISSDAVVELLNRCRNESQPVLTDLPSDLLTPAEAAALPEMTASGVTVREILNWTKRRRNPAPCFKINKQTRRLRRSEFVAWMDAATRITKGRAAR